MPREDKCDSTKGVNHIVELRWYQLQTDKPAGKRFILGR